MKILITGGAGYIGSHLCYKLLENNEVIIIDNFSNSVIINGQENGENIIYGDIRDHKIIDYLSKDIDIIIHMAAQINISKSIDSPIFDADNNIHGTLNMLDKARKSEIEHFIYISSAAVYGIPKYLPIDEEHSPNPISPYGLSKLTGERYAMLYHDIYGLPVTCLRFFNVFGPGQTINSYSGVITRFIENVRNNKSPIIFGNGNQIRDFVYIEDILEAIILSIKNDRAIGHVFNIGTGNPTKIKDLADILIKIANKKIKIGFEDSKIGDIFESYSNITKARNILGYEPKYSLEDGLRLCYFNSRNENSNKFDKRVG